MSIKNLVTQGELKATIAGLNALADNLSEHANQSLSKAHGWSILSQPYFDTGGNYHTDFAGGTSLVSIPGLFNTGVNNDNTLASPGTNDQHWTMIQSASKTFPGPAAIIENPIPSGYATNGPNSQWIGARISGSVSDGTYKFRISFDLTGLNAATAVISGVWASDNQTKSILLNGIATGYTLGDNSWKKQPAAKFTLSGPFLAGVNTLDFVLSNNSGPCSLRVEVSGKAAIGGVFGIPGLFNTGVDASNVVLVQGSVDPHWTLAVSPDTTNPGPNAYLMKLGGGYAANTAVSAWIGPRTTGSATAGLYTYRLSFDLTGLNPQGVVLKGQFWSNDEVQNTYINGIALGIVNTGSGKTYPTAFVITTGFLSGINTLDFIVKTNHEDSGFRAEITGTASPAGTSLTSRVLRLTVDGNVFYVPCQVSGGMDGQADPTIAPFTGIVSPQSADPASDLTVGSPTSSELVTTFEELLNAISTAASDTLSQHAGVPAEDVHGGLSWQPDTIFTSGGYTAGRRTINFILGGVQYKLVGDTNVNGPLNA
jgi:hypothetical protein